MVNKPSILLLLSLFLGRGVLLAQENKDSVSVSSFFDLEHAGQIDVDEGKALSIKKMEKQDYIPEIHGAIRGKYEYCSTLNESRFQVRNARISITGNVHPIVAYKAEVDLSDQGEMRMLDAYVRVFPVKGFSLTMGQLKVPFGTDNLRSPHQLYFANRSFMSKQIVGFRDVGFTMGYSYETHFPFTLLAGIYNGSGLYAQKEWHRTMSFAARASFDPCQYLNFSLNFQSFEPDSLRMNAYDVSIYTEFYGFHIETEYVYKTYANRAFQSAHAFNGFVNYDLKLPKVFHKISFLARYDMMTDNNQGYKDNLGQYSVDNVARQRVTTGITLSIAKPFIADVRINYEKYFYNDWSEAELSEQDKLVIELVARF